MEHQSHNGLPSEVRIIALTVYLPVRLILGTSVLAPRNVVGSPRVERRTSPRTDGVLYLTELGTHVDRVFRDNTIGTLKTY